MEKGGHAARCSTKRAPPRQAGDGLKVGDDRIDETTIFRKTSEGYWGEGHSLRRENRPAARPGELPIPPKEKRNWKTLSEDSGDEKKKNRRQ